MSTDKRASLDVAEPSAAPRYVVSERHITRVTRHMKQRHGSPCSSLIHACNRLTFSRDESHLRRAHHRTALRRASLDAAEPSAAPRYVVSERHITRDSRETHEAAPRQPSLLAPPRVQPFDLFT